MTIARRTGLSRNTIRKYLRSDDKEPSYAKHESRSRLDPFAEKLAQWLKTESGKNREQRRTLKQMHAELMELGYDGSYNRVAAFARDWALVVENALRILIAGFGVNWAESSFFDVVRLLRQEDALKGYFLERIGVTLALLAPGRLDLGTVPIELIGVGSS